MPSANRITLFATRMAMGSPRRESVFLDGPPLAVRDGARGKRALCREHRCARPIPVREWRYADHGARGRKVIELPGGPHQPSLDEGTDRIA